MFAFIYVATVGFYYSGERIVSNLRKAYLSAIIRQNLAFFDTLGAGEVTTRIASDMAIIQEAIISKVSLSLTAIGTFAAAIIIAFIYIWKSALILSPIFLVMVVAGVIAGGYSVQHHKLSMEISDSGSGVAEEAVASPRHVSAFGIQEFLAEEYLDYLREAEKSGVKAGNSVALLIAWSNAMPCLVYALSFWVGSIYLVRGETTVSSIATITLAIAIGAFAVVRVVPSILSGDWSCEHEHCRGYHGPKVASRSIFWSRREASWCYRCFEVSQRKAYISVPRRHFGIG